MIKTKVAFWRAVFFPANQSALNTFLITLIGWIKAGPPKKPLLFWSCKQAIITFDWLEKASIESRPRLKWSLACLHDQNKSSFFPPNQNFFNTFSIALIGWIKAGLPKSHFCFLCNRLNMLNLWKENNNLHWRRIIFFTFLKNYGKFQL